MIEIRWLGDRDLAAFSVPCIDGEFTVKRKFATDLEKTIQQIITNKDFFIHFAKVKYAGIWLETPDFRMGMTSVDTATHPLLKEGCCLNTGLARNLLGMPEGVQYGISVLNSKQEELCYYIPSC
jgi:hypothetical protein